MHQKTRWIAEKIKWKLYTTGRAIAQACQRCRIVKEKKDDSMRTNNQTVATNATVNFVRTGISPSSSQLKQNILGHTLAWWSIVLTTGGNLIFVLQADQAPPNTQKRGQILIRYLIPKTRIPLKIPGMVWSLQRREEHTTPNRLRRFLIASSDISKGVS